MKHEDDLEDLIDRHLHGELTEAEMERLAELLDSNPSARQNLVEQSLWHTRFAEVLSDDRDMASESDVMASVRQTAPEKQASKIAFPKLLLTAAAVVIVALSAGLFYQKASSERRIAVLADAIRNPAAEAPVAKVTGLSGSLLWTGDRGQIVRDVKVGTELAGGTIEGMAPDSWFELEFNDGSTVMISGNSMLTFADQGQKELRLKEGNFSANVRPQPEGKPMLVHTRSALLKVLGTQFDVEAGLTSTVLNVSEGNVRVKRLSDGSEVDVPAKHRVTADADRELTPIRVPDSVHHWKSQLHLGPEGNYGKWSRAINDSQLASLKAIPLVPQEFPSITLYLAGMTVARADNSPVVIKPDSHFIVRGRLDTPASVYFGVWVSHANGEFAGKFRGDLEERQPVAELDSKGRFETVYRLSDFTLDPCVRDREDELPASPAGLVLNGVWAFTHTGSPSGLEVTEIELLPPE